MILESLSLINCLILLLVGLFLVVYVTRRDLPPNMPPGPRGLPLFGSLLTLADASNASQLLLKMSKKYGPVMTVRLGNALCVVVSGCDMVREGLVEKAEYFSARPSLPVWERINRKKGILFTNQFKERRRLVLTSMRDFGLGKKSLDDRMVDEAQILVQELEKHDGKSFKLHDLIPVVTTNIICTIIRGDRFSYDCEFMKTITACFNTVINTTEYANTDNYIPWVKWLKYVPFLNIRTWEGPRNDAFVEVASHIKSWIEEHRKSFDGDNIRDLIDLFLSEVAKNNPQIKEENVQQILFDLFAAGTETTSTTTLWAIAYLMVHKDVQTRCRREVHEVVGRGRTPEYKDATSLPYINSVINEVQRMGNIAPLAFFHSTSSRVDLGGFTIPKDTMVTFNLESVLKDEKYWGDPYTFRPERWLDEEGKLIKNQAHIPFSAGKRECLGMLLARKELFIFLSAMLQNFEFDMEDKTKPPNLSKGHGLLRSAPDYMVKVSKV